MNRKRKNLAISIIVVGLICLFTIGLTYAFFLMLQQSNIINNSSTAGKLDIIYENGQDIEGRLISYTDNSRALQTTATIKKSSVSVDALATITLHINSIDTELATNAFKWEVYENSGTTPVNSGNFNNMDDGDTIDVISNYELTTTDTVFTIKLWIDSALNSNSIYNKTFSGYIDASAINKPASVS